jgi:hypothetical protein
MLNVFIFKKDINLLNISSHSHAHSHSHTQYIRTHDYTVEVFSKAHNNNLMEFKITKPKAGKLESSIIIEKFTFFILID